ALRERFAERLGQVASRPDAVPIEFDGHKIEARRGSTLLGAAMKNGHRLMHVCGARTLCGTCRVTVAAGADNLTPISTKEKLSLRYHLSMSSRTRLACQARVEGPVEVEPVFPLCGELPIAESNQR
ncbi:MAG TPA: 2Fe-2S iron-sulfur cluster-binding protein, partial [Candidatus Binataceae bacterium]|nr:2Fe-2S iron-sulfur cluster-binding protein [Candidatus Binataceae bacterium]